LRIHGSPLIRTVDGMPTISPVKTLIHDGVLDVIADDDAFVSLRHAGEVSSRPWISQVAGPCAFGSGCRGAVGSSFRRGSIRGGAASRRDAHRDTDFRKGEGCCGSLVTDRGDVSVDLGTGDYRQF
jgi:hypothetical protein